MGIDLPPEASKIFESFESEECRTVNSRRFSSLYPDFAVSVRQDGGVDDHERDKFLEKWDTLTLS